MNQLSARGKTSPLDEKFNPWLSVILDETTEGAVMFAAKSCYNALAKLFLHGQVSRGYNAAVKKYVLDYGRGNVIGNIAYDFELLLRRNWYSRKVIF